MSESWHYECSICQKVCHADDMARHLEMHRTEPSWPGHISWTRVDHPDQTNIKTEVAWVSLPSFADPTFESHTSEEAREHNAQVDRLERGWW